jgi:hypothetical protein
MADTSSNQNLSKIIVEALKEARKEEGVGKVLMKAYEIYDSYAYKLGETLIRIIRNAPQAVEEYTRLVERLQKWGECKSFLTRDENALEKCRDEYNFRDGLIEGIKKYFVFLHTPEEIKEFTEALKFLANEQVIDRLYKLYQEVKKLKLEYLSDVNKYNPMTKEDLDRRLYESSSEFVESYIFHYLEDPKGRKQQFMKHLGYIPLETADIAACRLYGGCKTEKQNT